MKYHFLLTTVPFLLISCANLKKNGANFDTKDSFSSSKEIVLNDTKPIDDTTFVNLKDYSKDFVYEMRYATKNNFLKQKVYDCASCYLRLKTVKSLVRANDDFMKKGFKIKIYDCYRPLDVQKKMWKIVSDPNYVANPAKGSIHNRGGAVDISLVDNKDKNLDMGTDFDFFGKEAAHDFKGLSDTIVKNRIFLKTIMIQNNFKIFDSEWWHYNLVDSNKDNISNFKWKCE